MSTNNSPKFISLGNLSLIFIIVGTAIVIISFLVGANPLNLISFILGFSQEPGKNMLDNYPIEMVFFVGLFLVIIGGSYLYKFDKHR